MSKSKKDLKFEIREIALGDLKNGYFPTIKNLSELGSIEGNIEKAEQVLDIISSNPLHKIFVAIDKQTSEVIGATTLLVEQKFIHSGGKAGHIEDVVTRKGFEGLGIGSALINNALNFAKAVGCYKVVLDCSDTNINFYQKTGFRVHETSMRYDLL
ncbi:MAG: GNAT family N-acetyltransferase [Nitrososphaeraceae archaeon]|jgi:glucosamine-phosphate N-acetyltransferase